VYKLLEHGRVPLKNVEVDKR